MFPRVSKPFWTELLYKKNFPPDDQTGQAKLYSQPVNLPGSHSCPQRLCSFWSAPRITTSGKVQHRKSAIYGLTVTLLISESSVTIWSAENAKLLFCACLKDWTFSEFSILGADQRSTSFGDENVVFQVHDETPGNVISFHLMPNCLVDLISVGPNYRTLAL